MSSSPEYSFKPASASSSQSSKQSDQDPTSKQPSSAVLFRGPPLSAFPSVARYIASQLALSPPSPLKVLHGASFTSHQRYPDDGGMVPQTLKLRPNDITATTADGHQRNGYYQSTLDSNGRRRQLHSSQTWGTIEMQSVVCSDPPTQMLSLFDGLVLYVESQLGEYQTELQDVFELFGGRVIN